MRRGCSSGPISVAWYAPVSGHPRDRSPPPPARRCHRPRDSPYWYRHSWPSSPPWRHTGRRPTLGSVPTLTAQGLDIYSRYVYQQRFMHARPPALWPACFSGSSPGCLIHAGARALKGSGSLRGMIKLTGFAALVGLVAVPFSLLEALARFAPTQVPAPRWHLSAASSVSAYSSGRTSSSSWRPRRTTDYRPAGPSPPSWDRSVASCCSGSACCCWPCSRPC